MAAVVFTACIALTTACADSTGSLDQRIGEPDDASGIFTAVDVGDNTTCALDQSGRAYCWGSNSGGLLGTGETALRVTRAQLVMNVPSAFHSISVGADHQCALTSDGRGFCWGGNGRGQLGAGVQVQPGSVASIAGGLTFASISAGDGYTCAITTQHLGYCWGDSANGQLGAGAAYTCGYTVFPCSVDTPVPVAGDLHFAQISTGFQHTCAVTDDGTGYCWGDNRNGELGDPSVPINCVAFPAAALCVRDVPNMIPGGLKFTQLAAGAYHTCGITTTGEAYCWGLATGNPDINAFALGNAAYSGARGTQRGSRVPVPVAGELTFREITTSNGVSCGLTVSNEAVCWGNNNYGDLGVGIDPGYTTSPLQVRMPAALHAPAIDTDDHACTLTTTGRIWCWGGLNWFGEIGSGTVTVPFPGPFEVHWMPEPVNAPDSPL
ncbi:MAG: RCC1 domain-containing protein [Gemmatimonadaceae bacterium]